MEGPPKIKNKNIIESSNAISRYLAKEKSLVQKDTCTPIPLWAGIT